MQGVRASQPFASALEVNLNCQNTHGRTGDFLTAERFFRLGRRLRSESQLPLFLKVNQWSNREEQEMRLALVEAAVAVGLDGFSLSCAARVRDTRLSSGEGNLRGRSFLVRLSITLPRFGMWFEDVRQSALEAEPPVHGMSSGFFKRGLRPLRFTRLSCIKAGTLLGT